MSRKCLAVFISLFLLFNQTGIVLAQTTVFDLG